MAEPESGGKSAEVLGKDPKKRKMVAIGIGVAALLFVYLMMKKNSTASTATAAATPVTTQPIADVTVPSDQQSSSDLTAQWATMQQATMQELASMLSMQEQGQPGAPPAGGYTPAQAGSYTVTGRTNPSDQYPLGVAVAAYGLSSADYVNQAYDSVQIQAENPTKIPPYAVGTVLAVPQITTNEQLSSNVTSQVAPVTGSSSTQPLIVPLSTTTMPKAIGASS